jgi:hypothetical protein
MNKRNLIMLNSMIRLSRILRNCKDARRNLDLVIDQTSYFIVAGEVSNMIQVQAQASTSNVLFVEQYLRSSVSKICISLDGFDPGKMDPIDYISSSDIRDGIVDICRGKKIVANINLSSGEIIPLSPELESTGEDKSSAEKS